MNYGALSKGVVPDNLRQDTILSKVRCCVVHLWSSSTRLVSQVKDHCFCCQSEDVRTCCDENYCVFMDHHHLLSINCCDLIWLSFPLLNGTIFIMCISPLLVIE